MVRVSQRVPGASSWCWAPALLGQSHCCWQLGRAGTPWCGWEVWLLLGRRKLQELLFYVSTPLPPPTAPERCVRQEMRQVWYRGLVGGLGVAVQCL